MSSSARNKTSRLAFAVGLLAVIGACSSSDDSTAGSTAGTEPTTQGSSADSTVTTGPVVSGQPTQLIDAGSEPRVDLSISDDFDSSVMVQARWETVTDVDGSSQTDLRTASFHLALSMGVSGDSVRLEIVPTLDSIDDEPAPGTDLGTWRWRLDGDGEVLSVDDNEASTLLGRSTAGLLSTPNLVLATPDVPVGLGAQWSYLVGAGGADIGVVTLHEITDTTLAVTIELDVAAEGGSLSIVGTATYDRASLVVRDAEFDTVLTVESEVSENGELVSLVGSRRNTVTYVGVSP